MNKFLLILSLPLVLLSCKKNRKPPSSDKLIMSFNLKASLNPGLSSDVIGVVKFDSIILAVPPNTSLTRLVPSIVCTGVSVKPANGSAQNFSGPLTYTVTAADKSTKTYTVIVRFQSTEKSIVSFVFKADNNQESMSTDAVGTIDGDTIRVQVNSNNFSSLKATVLYTGVSISPASQTAINYMQPVSYNVTAEDGSIRKYTVVVNSASSLFIGGGQDSNLYCFDAITGKIKWKYKMGARIITSPTYAAGIVYITNLTFLYALDAATGQLKWQTNLSSGAGTSPQVVNGRVYVAVGGPSKLIAVDAATGTIQWSQNLGGGTIVLSNPTVAQDRVVVGDSYSFLRCFDANSGARLWSFDAGIILDNPAVVNGTVYIGSEFYEMLAIDLTTGLKKWDVRSTTTVPVAGVGSSPTVYKGVLYGGASSLSAYDTATGKLKWEYSAVNSAFSNPVGDNDLIYVSNLGNIVYAITTAGSLKWFYGNVASTNQPVTAPSVVVANGVVYAGNGYDNNLVALDGLTGQLSWIYTGSAPFSPGACVVDGSGKIFHSAISGTQQ